MTVEVLQGDCREVLAGMAAGLNRLLAAMRRVMAISAQADDIVRVDSFRFIASPRQDMMSVQPPRAYGPFTALTTAVAISTIDAPQQSPTGRRGIKPLAFWAAAILVVGICVASATIHAVARSAQIRLRVGRLLAEDALCLLAVMLALERVWPLGFGNPWRLPVLRRNGALISHHGHVIVGSGQIVSALARCNLKVHEFLPDSFRVTSHQFANGIRRKAFNDVLLSQPFLVQVLRLHAPIVTPSMAACQ